jgi:hypothetical protein
MFYVSYISKPGSALTERGNHRSFSRRGAEAQGKTRAEDSSYGHSKAEQTIQELKGTL